MSDWYPEAQKAIELCEGWSRKVKADATLSACELFLFGSAIYERGEQFDLLQSDLDVVCLLPAKKSIPDRVALLQGLHQMKLDLEIAMIRDPLPKSLVRSAAQISPALKDGEWYDTRKGLDHLFRVLGDRQGEHDQLEQLYRKVSIRRGGRGQKEALTPIDQLLLAEILFDEALKGEIEEVVRWELRLQDDVHSVESLRTAVAAIERLAPRSYLEGYRYGSIILQLRSPKSTFELVAKLHGLNVLSDVLGVRVLDLRIVSEVVHEPDAEGRVGRLLRYLEDWNASGSGDWHGIEERLANHINGVLLTDPELADAEVSRDVSLSGPGERELDFLLRWTEPSGKTSEAIGIEVTTSRSLGSFFEKATRFLDVGRPLILVFVLPEFLRGKVTNEAARLETLNPNIHVVIHTLLSSSEG